MEQKEYTVKECLEILGISKATFYVKINANKNSLGQHITTKNGKKYISPEGLDFLKCLGAFSETVQSNQTSPEIPDDSDTPDNSLIAALREQIEELKDDKKMLRNELDTRNKQIDDQNRLLENSQVINQQNQQKIFFLESREQKEEFKPTWWKRLFS